MTYTSSESFRLYPFQGSAAPRDLRLTFRKIGGMTPYGTVSAPGGTSAPWTLTGFNMTFADVIQNSENTEKEIASHAGGKPLMPVTYALSNITTPYIKADAFNALMISADVPGGLITTSDDVAVLPMKVRLRIARREAPLVGRWEEIEKADSVIDAFANICTLWVRSPNTTELDMNLFTTLSNRGYSAKQCMQAFTQGDFLYLDFIVLLADAVSQNASKTAFCQVVEDDKVPYILIGDGSVDNHWNLTFYVTAAGNPSVDPLPLPNNPSSDSGGGCNQGSVMSIGIISLFAAWGMRRKSRRSEK
jgi:hypothetical protein